MKPKYKIGQVVDLTYEDGTHKMFIYRITITAHDVKYHMVDLDNDTVGFEYQDKIKEG
jgi:hypothetical protein